MTFVSVFVYAVTSFLVGLSMICVAYSPLNPQVVTYLNFLVHESLQTRLMFGLAGTLIILLSIKWIKGKQDQAQRQKTIAFKGANGEVSIALMALEDMIKKHLASFSELQEVRPQIVVAQKGRKKNEIHVELKVVLESCYNVPELTADIQESVKAKLLNLLGIEESIFVDISIRKIISAASKKSTTVVSDDTLDSNPMPFRDY